MSDARARGGRAPPPGADVFASNVPIRCKALRRRVGANKNATRSDAARRTCLSAALLLRRKDRCGGTWRNALLGVPASAGTTQTNRLPASATPSDGEQNNAVHDFRPTQHTAFRRMH